MLSFFARSLMGTRLIGFLRSDLNSLPQMDPFGCLVFRLNDLWTLAKQSTVC
jgi:hypothetical protein